MLAMLSGGRDSVCLLHMLRSPALHMNYGLRAEADADEAFCRELCAELGVPLTVVRPSSPRQGNLQAWAREERYAAAERLTDGEIAVAHTASDQAETVLYRLLTSGRVQGMPARRGRIVRPLLGWTREQTTAYCLEHNLSWREDASNSEDRYARNRIRALLATFPDGERSVLRALELLTEDDEALSALVCPETSVEALRALPPALQRRTLSAMAGLPVRDCERVLRGADLGGGLRSVVEHGQLRLTREGGKPGIDQAEFTVPSQIRFGAGVLTAEVSRFPTGLDARSLGDRLVARTWRPGDRMKPLGMNGHSKRLQDIFTDRKVPRETRHRLPVVVSGGEIAWIPGVVSETFRARGGATVRLSFELGSG